jgi:hypothetical protein
MGVDQLPILPKRRSSLTPFHDIICYESALVTGPDNTSSNMSCQRSSSNIHDSNTERVRWKDGGSSPSCGSRPGELHSQTSRNSSRDNSSSKRKFGRTDVMAPSSPHKPVKARRCWSFDGISLSQKSISPSLPTVQEFQRANFEQEDEQVLESFRRSRSCGGSRLPQPQQTRATTTKQKREAVVCNLCKKLDC